MNRMLLFAVTATLFSISGTAYGQDVPDVNLRMILNDAIPGGLTDANGNVINPNAYVDMLDINSDASIAPIDLTGLEFVSCNYLRMSSLPGGSFTNFPAFPTMVGPDAVIQIDHFDGPELPMLPPGLSVFLLWSPQPTLQSWYLNGYDDGVDLNVEVNELSASTPWALVTEYVNHLSIAAYPHVDPPVLGVGVKSIGLFGALEMTTMPVFDNDLRELTVQDCPMITSISFAGQVDTLETLWLQLMDGLTSIAAMPVVNSTINLELLPQLATAEFGPCPGRLTVVGIPANALTTLPPGLDELYIGSIDDLALPPLPTSLRVLNIGYCSIASFSSFNEGLEEIIVEPTNVLTCVPYLPSTLVNLTLDGVACYPNQPPLIAPLTLCTILNSYCPEVSAYVRGHVFYDYDNNGVQNVLEPDASNISIMASPSGHMVGTDNEGNYALGLPNGQHTLALTEIPTPFIGSDPVSLMADLPTVLDSVVGLDFALYAPEGLTIDRRADRAYHSVARPGYEHTVFINCSIFGLDADSTVLTIEFDTTTVFQYSDFSYESVIDHTMIVKFAPNSGAAIAGRLRLYLPDTAVLGSMLTVRVGIGPNVNDLDITNDSLVYTYTVVGSFDPNDKQVSPSVLTPAQVVGDTLVEYAIRFQNTGTYMAERVLITDTLSTDLRWDSFRFLQSSHPCEWFMRDGVVHFVFNDIMLPDSTTDEAGSHGFVRFSIRPNEELTEGMIVSNEANIYFDFNEPVITDPCELMIEIPSGIPVVQRNELNVFPVPATDRITIPLPFEGAAKGYLFGADGRAVRTFSAFGQQVTLEIVDLQPGHYVIRCTDQRGLNYLGRFVKL